MQQLNSYYGMAENDYLYAKAGLETCKALGNYNAVASGCSQAAEKYLKALVERCMKEDVGVVAIMRSHNLRTIAEKLQSYFPDITLNVQECKWLGNYYFETRYPGDNFTVVSQEDGEECIRIVETIRESITEKMMNSKSKIEQTGTWKDLKRL